MKKIFTILLTTVLFISSCEVEVPEVWGCTDYSATNYYAAATEDDGSCIYPCYTGTLTIKSYESDPYSVRINNVSYGSISSYGTKSIELPIGYYSAEITQLSGYAFFPTVYSSSLINISGCETTNINFGLKQE